MSRATRVPTSLFTPAIRDKFTKLYSGLAKRAQPKLWKNGRNAGKVRVAGIQSLPFTKEQLVDHVYAQIGNGMIRCPYCVEIGRGANLIDLSNFVLDHFEPVARVGIAAHELKNLRVCCEDCNNCKGSLSYQVFLRVMRLTYEVTVDEIDRKNLMMCLRSHGVTMRLRFSPHKNKAEKEAEAKQSFESTAPIRNKPKPAPPMSLFARTATPDW